MSTNDENLELPEVDATLDEDYGIEGANPAILDEAYAEEEARLEQEHAELAHARRDFVPSSRILNKTYPGMEYLIGPNVLPKKGKLLITAETGVGKSYIALHMAACLATGTALFGLKHNRHDENFGKPVFPVPKSVYVTYLDYEIPEHLRKDRLKPLQERFAEIGKDFGDNLVFFDKASDYRLMNMRTEDPNKGSFDKLFSKVRASKPGVLIVDPFSSTHSMNEISNEIRQPLTSLDRFIDHSGCSVILVHHSSTKSKTDDRGKSIERKVREMPRGHSSILDWCDAHLHITDMSHGAGHSTKTLQLDWGKTRYLRAPLSRQIVLNYETFHIEPFTL